MLRPQTILVETHFQNNLGVPGRGVFPDEQILFFAAFVFMISPIWGNEKDMTNRQHLGTQSLSL